MNTVKNRLLKNDLNNILRITLLFLGFFFIHSSVSADQDQSKSHHCITRFENGSVNWSTGKISAIGKASPEDNTETSHESVPGSARADANRRIIEILKQINITNALSVDSYASRNDVILAGIEKTARDAHISKQYYTSALAVEIIIETSILGGFLQLVLPEDIRQITKISPETRNSGLKEIGENIYTGLIIDARGLKIEPVLNPVIVSEQGHEVYSPVYISREFAVQNGVCKYICSMDQALKDKRIGNHPLVLKGLRKEVKQNTVIVISMSDYYLLEKTTERHVFLKECRVIIVKD